MKEKEIDGIREMREAMKALGINLNELIARTSLWVHPECYQFHTKVHGNGIYYQNVRRMKKGERKRQIIDGILADDNTYANFAAKKLLGIKHAHIRNYAVCHIYENSCYDSKYHTELANLVLIPRPLASLSDYLPETIETLKYRSYESYGFFIGTAPNRPDNYPEVWKISGPLDERTKRVIQNKRVRVSGNEIEEQEFD